MDNKTYVVMMLTPPGATLPDGTKMDSFVSHYMGLKGAQQLLVHFLNSYHSQMRAEENIAELHEKVIDDDCRVLYHKLDNAFPIFILAPETGKTWNTIDQLAGPVLVGENNKLARRYYEQMAQAEAGGKLKKKKPAIKGGTIIKGTKDGRAERRKKEQTRTNTKPNYPKHNGNRSFSSGKSVVNVHKKRERDENKAAQKELQQELTNISMGAANIGLPDVE